MSKAKKTAEALAAGERVRSVRKAKGLSLAALSNLTGGVLSGSRIGNYEQGTRELDIAAARLIGRVTGAHPAYLMALLSDEEHRFLQALQTPTIEAKKPDRPFRVVASPTVEPPRKRSSRTSPY